MMATKHKSSSSSSKKSSGKPTPMVVNKNTNLNVREIENGFIVRESGTRGKGRNQEYWDKEYFSKTNPVRVSGGSGGSGGKMSFGSKK